MLEYSAGSCPEDDAPKANQFGATGAGCFRVFTRAHGEEECSQCDVGCLGVGWVLVGSGSSGEQMVKFSKEFGCDGLLPTRWRVGVVKCF